MTPDEHLTLINVVALIVFVIGFFMFGRNGNK